MPNITNREESKTAIREAYKKIIPITNNWLMIAKAHGYFQSKNEIKTLKEFVEVMKKEVDYIFD